MTPYKKVLVNDCGAVCAIYEPHPFRKSAMPNGFDCGIDDNEWIWVFYDWCGNPVGISNDMPDGKEVQTFTEENIGSQSLADYLNKENSEAIERWRKAHEKNA